MDVSAEDGRMGNNERLYVISDIAIAAYLLMRGFELLGAIDSGNMSPTGKPRKDFGLTHVDHELNLDNEAQMLIDEYQNVQFIVPHSDARVNFKVYNQKMRELKHALDEAIRR